jgi:hypothetical protein
MSHKEYNVHLARFLRRACFARGARPIARGKRLGKPTERGSVLWFPPIHPIYAAGRERATRKIKLKGKKS